MASGPPPPYPAVTAVPLPALPALPLCNTRYDELDYRDTAPDTTHYDRSDGVTESLLQQHDAERAVPPRQDGVRGRVEGNAGGLHGEPI